MIQVLDRFRKEYKKETGNPCEKSFYVHNDMGAYSHYPTWEYVCWLENRLAGWEGILKEESYTITTASTIKGAENGNVSSSKR